MGLPSSLKPYLLVLLFCFLNVSTTNSTKRLKEEVVFFGGNLPALYVIGDSLVDSGNNNYLPTLLKANFTPYGFNFEGGIPTGRFSDGKTIADYIAIYFDLPLVPPYMGLSEKQKNNISTGINYASGGCGVFPDTGKPQPGGCLSMGVQVDLFNQTIEKNLKQNFKTQSELNNHLAESLFLIASGTNDYGFTYNESSTDANSFAEKLLNDYWLQIQRLHKLGARKFFINNIKPIGCYPSTIDKTVPRGSCDEKINLAVTIYNVKLRASLSDMRRHKLSNTSFLYSDYFNFMLALRGPSSNQVSSKLLNTTSPCCPMFYVQGKFPTCLPGSVPCKLPEMYIFFDPNHPTQMANFIYAIQCFQERKFCHVVRDRA